MNDFLHCREALTKFFGFESFLDHQKEIIEKILSKKNLCVVMPTGAGKSLCYQLPALLFPGYTLIVSPLIALMADQVSALNAKSIPAAFINSSIGFQEQLSALRAAEAGELKLLYIAPERLQNDIFRDFIKRCPPDM
ncbi:MAG: DEAD/DEAH box helicase, partial [Lentisphaeria bacterium]|nr:DEAD/DEAH box helicase [Lentisphaeria bacterium]